MKIRKASVEDFLKLHDLIGKIEGIVQHPTHFYKIMINNFGNSIIIAEESGELTGFLLGFVSQTDPDEFFIWQLGVDPAFRGRKIAKRIMQATIDSAADHKCKRITATVETTNKASQRLFESSGFIIVTNESLGELIEEHDKLAVKDYYASGTNQVFYQLNITPDN